MRKSPSVGRKREDMHKFKSTATLVANRPHRRADTLLPSEHKLVQRSDLDQVRT